MSRDKTILWLVFATSLGVSASVSAATYEVDLVGGSLEYSHVYTGPDFDSEQCSFIHNELTPPPVEFTNVIMQEFFDCTYPWLARMDGTGLVYQASWPEFDASFIRLAQYRSSLESQFEVFEPTLMQVTSSILGVPATGSYHDLWVLDLNRGEHTIHELNLGEQSLSLMLEPGFYEVGISVDMMGEPTDGVTIAAYSAEIVVALEESDPVSVATQSWGHIKALYRQ